MPSVPQCGHYCPSCCNFRGLLLLQHQSTKIYSQMPQTQLTWMIFKTVFVGKCSHVFIKKKKNSFSSSLDCCSCAKWDSAGTSSQSCDVVMSCFCCVIGPQLHDGVSQLDLPAERLQSVLQGFFHPSNYQLLHSCVVVIISCQLCLLMWPVKGQGHVLVNSKTVSPVTSDFKKKPFSLYYNHADKINLKGPLWKCCQENKSVLHFPFLCVCIMKEGSSTQRDELLNWWVTMGPEMRHRGLVRNRMECFSDPLQRRTNFIVHVQYVENRCFNVHWK